jgi:glycolate oxidase
MLGRIEAIAAESEVVIANIAHAGDGNLHPLIVAPDVQRMHAAIKQAFDPHRILNPGKAFPYER